MFRFTNLDDDGCVFCSLVGTRCIKGQYKISSLLTIKLVKEMLDSRVPKSNIHDWTGWEEEDAVRH